MQLQLAWMNRQLLQSRIVLHAAREGEMRSTRIHWGRIVVGGLLAEVALILAIVPLGLRLGDNFLHYTAPPGSFITCFLGALWVCRRVESHFCTGLW